MAVVFISPKQKQKTFFIGITIIFLLFLAGVFLGVFFSEPQKSLLVPVFNKAKVSIDMSIFDSSQFRDLQPFTEIQTQYSYKATTKDNKTRTGFIFADSIDDARIIIMDMGLTVIEIKEAEMGRDNPFAPYY